MKKSLLVLLSTVLVFGITGCGAKSEVSSQDKKTIIVGATPVPSGDILKQVKPILEKKGYKLEIKEFTDYVTPNTALADKQIDANLFQHAPYLEKFNEEKHTDLQYTSRLFIAPMGVYSKKFKKITELKDGAIVAVPNDPTNESRALKLLETGGLIKLKEGKTLTKVDIIENKKGIQIKEVDAPQLPRVLEDIDAAIINTNYALEAKINPLKDSILLEDKNSPYVNVLAVRKEDKDKTYIKALSEALSSPEVKKYIEEKYKGSLIVAF